jgi:citrate lyase alpha subunit
MAKVQSRNPRTKTANDKPVDANAIRVRCMGNNKTFFRGGYRFTSEPRTLLLADLTAQEISLITEEPKLQIEFIVADQG